MENQETIKKLSFYGEGAKLFGIQIVNFLLTIITLGLYYPWARASFMKYIYQETEFEGSRFTFHGTGQEMFKGLLKVILFVLVIYGLTFILGIFIHALLGTLFFYLAFFILIPFAIHGSLKYRLSRTSWRGIHFSYHGDLIEFCKLYYLHFFITIVTFGIYGSWFSTKIDEYITDNIKFGNIDFGFDGKGDDLFIINLKGIFFMMFTFGLYGFWYFRNRFEFRVNHTYLNQEDKGSRLNTEVGAGEFFELFIVNYFLVVFTLGLAIPWVIIRNINFFVKHVSVEGNVDFDQLVQNAEENKDATGDDLLDFMDIDII